MSLTLPTLHTARLTVRPLNLADVPAFTAYHNDPEVALYQSWDMPYPLARAEALAREMQVLTSEWATLTLEAKGGAALGNLSVRCTSYRTAEVGFTLARAEWGRGYAHEGLTALLSWLFEDESRGGAELHRVHASLDPRNARSAALLTRANFRFEGCSVAAYWHRQSWTDDAHYAMLQSEWHTQQEALRS
ncbi:GNAT family N-acetyltransferase [Deinococcus detaillensis]|uniref:GNAT family N-acetyltransferase n=1 Tax=Deinococcus detaillensis TaxID=2592048 RepID=A0A553V1N2_9DEIO|nr:GNAT family protein [Deinococcus detaillensis]TSA86356.1 GNAT family N-acetyltransferase [Deinococcus detaillensis]